MLLIRTTVLLGLGVLVLPTDEASQVRFANTARGVMGWTMTFCDRNAGTCEQGRQAWAVFVKKAEFGAKMAIDLIAERSKQTANAPQQPARSQDPRALVGDPAAPRQRGTLKAGDLEPAWRGKFAHNGG